MSPFAEREAEPRIKACSHRKPPVPLRIVACYVRRCQLPEGLMSRVLITSALPYANGPIHIGHLVEHVQTDVWARFRRLMGDEVLHLCADDTHGTGIELNARKEGITPEELVARSQREHERDFAAFGINFDSYYTTNSPENQELANLIYHALKDGGHIERKSSMQMYSESLGRFLPDRWVKGTCPKCGTPDQYGDQCGNCNTTYEPADLINPVDAIEGKTPVLRETEQLYVRLADFVGELERWVPEGVPQPAVRNFVDRWMEAGLADWCISRDAPYFGFEIPGETGKYFYVWLDAPVGYIATTKQLCDARGMNWRDWWDAGSDAEIVHVIGKDIVYFHTLFWPAMLHAAGLKQPSRVQAHGFLTVAGEKMSKSRGTFIRAEVWAEHLDPSYLRFYYATKLGNGIDDMDLNLEDFVNRVNSDLVNNAVNLASRVTKFIAARFDGQVCDFETANHPLCDDVASAVDQYRALMQDWDIRGATRLIAELGDKVNTYFQEAAPWALIKTDPAAAQECCSAALHAATVLMTLLSPIVPDVAAKYADAIGVDVLGLEHTSPAWRPALVAAPDSIISRVQPAAVDAVIEASKQAPTDDAVDDTSSADLEAIKPEISFDDFSKVDLRIGKVVSASEVEGARKLLQLTVDIGREINVFAGIRQAYPDPAVLVGASVVVVANLAPRKMRFGVSEGMLLATSAADDSGLQLVQVDPSALAGWTVR